MTQFQMRQCYYFFPLFLGLFMFLLSGCSKSVEMQPHFSKDDTLVKEKKSETIKSNKTITPLHVEKGEFSMIAGWINNNKLIYVTNIGTGSNVYMYDLFSNKSDLLYTSAVPITSIFISPSKDKLLIQSTIAANKEEITIINQKGKTLFNQKVDAFDISYSWNPYDENIILMSTFTEDWNDQQYKINLNLASSEQIHLPNPFSFWINNKEVVYLQWDQEHLNPTAPLEKRIIEDSLGKEIMSNIYQVDTFRDTLLTISFNETKKEETQYSFYSNTLKPIGSFSIPYLTNFSNVLIPFYSYVQDQKKLYTFKPFYSAETDSYHNSFELISYDLNNNRSSTVISGLENEPISCSPNGKWCLYGFYFEKLINIMTKDVIHLYPGISDSKPSAKM
ncbi:hypothetical protein [Bacillus sp. 03113]|uniref:YqgU-like beta propeller domain-containing protein n=1 Tax=Bacillus sp. 03113 TaxID=2578211 RepID=UPI001141B842|nr:hypothetical protein [Bacillus sp. 03113]